MVSVTRNSVRTVLFAGPRRGSMSPTHTNPKAHESFFFFPHLPRVTCFDEQKDDDL